MTVLASALPTEMWISIGGIVLLGVVAVLGIWKGWGV
jgi:hypothetical protein